MTIEHRQPIIKCNCCGMKAEMLKGKHAPMPPDGWGRVTLYPALAGVVIDDACPECLYEIGRLIVEYRGERAGSCT